MNSPKFSVIIPTYNRGYMIMPTLNSLFSQTFKDFEIIVVDNCSTDNTDEVLASLITEGKIKFIKHDKNYERAKSRNTGMENATGDYVTFLDSDDFLYPTCIEEASKFVDENPKKRIFHCLYELVDENLNKLKNYSFPSIRNAKEKILVGNFLACIGVFIHRDIYSHLRFDTTSILTGSEDHEFWIRVIGQFSDLGRVNKVLCGIQEHANRTMNQTDVVRSFERKEYIYNKLISDKNLVQNYPNKASLFRAYSMAFVASASLDNQERFKAWKYLLKSILSSPRFVFNEFFMKVFILSITKH